MIKLRDTRDGRVFEAPYYEPSRHDPAVVPEYQFVEEKIGFAVAATRRHAWRVVIESPTLRDAARISLQLHAYGLWASLSGGKLFLDYL